jgi:hypothetical protein
VDRGVRTLIISTNQNNLEKELSSDEVPWRKSSACLELRKTAMGCTWVRSTSYSGMAPDATAPRPQTPRARERCGIAPGESFRAYA